MVPRFERSFFRSPEPISRIGEGELGGKARGLVVVRDLLADALAAAAGSVSVHVPKMTVLATDAFDRFMRTNGLDPAELVSLSDDRLGSMFQRAELPVEIVGDLRALVEEVRTPLAVRSSSLLEDALAQPFAGVYETKMVPNNQPDADTRFRRLVEAIKLVYASTYFESARDYMRGSDHAPADEKMAVVIQEVVGERHGDRFYPQLSGVARSYNFFPTSGASPRDGVVNLALGLGKTIVDGGTSWLFSPARPRAPAPFGSVRDMLRETQLEFWAVNMGRPPAYDPLDEAEYLVRATLSDAEYDGTLAALASTYDAGRDRLVPGTATGGPRVVDFAPLLANADVRFADLVARLLAAGERALGGAVELEFAATLGGGGTSPVRLAVLQLRPMLVSDETVELTDSDLEEPGLLLASERAMGHGAPGGISDVVYVRPDRFESRLTQEVVPQVAEMDRELRKAGRPYVLIGFGRWGSSDPWLGIPVRWGQIAGARVIVESTLTGMEVEASQGAHFFHNMVAAGVLYLCVRDAGGGRGNRAIDWEWLAARPAEHETELLRHLRLASPLRVKVDGRASRGAIWHPVY